MAELVTVAEAADATGVSEWTIWKWLTRRLLRRYRRGGRVGRRQTYVDLEEMRALLAERDAIEPV